MLQLRKAAVATVVPYHFDCQSAVSRVSDLVGSRWSLPRVPTAVPQFQVFDPCAQRQCTQCRSCCCSIAPCMIALDVGHLWAWHVAVALRVRGCARTVTTA